MRRIVMILVGLSMFFCGTQVAMAHGHGHHGGSPSYGHHAYYGGYGGGYGGGWGGGYYSSPMYGSYGGYGGYGGCGNGYGGYGYGYGYPQPGFGVSGRNFSMWFH